MVVFGSVNGLLTHVANGQKYSRSALGFPSDVGEVGNFLDKQRGTLAAALNPKSLPGTLPYQNFEINLLAAPVKSR